MFKSSIFLFFITSLCYTPIVIAQEAELTGEVKTKGISTVFQGFQYNQTPVTGEIKSNITSSKYTLNIAGGDNSLAGSIQTREFKWVLDLKFNTQSISGEVKIPVSGDSFKWNVDFLGNPITGTIKSNLAHTKTTFNLESKEMKVTGAIIEKITSVEYLIFINGKAVNGVVQTTAGSNLKYHLKLDELNQKELALFFLMESMRIIVLDKEATDKFQNGK